MDKRKYRAEWWKKSKDNYIKVATEKFKSENSRKAYKKIYNESIGTNINYEWIEIYEGAKLIGVVYKQLKLEI